ncbi:ricin-type beta-trefoil lectin domain protein [Streptomyces sp. NRRL WC-3618]|nr:RICIN domain-containing protein [Streptomyces sp. NRRL WC-3618]KOV60362.1 ricin-type beta-trefoil lectin domain protein [Streptomyces sp. NRRL WC-3618]
MYGACTDAPDAHLTELLRTNSPTAYPALRELRARHQASVLAYARLCATSDATAEQLAAEVFTAAARDAAHGAEPSVPWRHQLLLLTADLAAGWAADERAAGLDPSLLLVLNTLMAGSGVGRIPAPPLLGPFQSLPSRAQGLIWYGIVERESEDRTATLLGLTREDVAHELDSALQALAQACLWSRLVASHDPRCQDFRRLIEQSVRPVNPRHSTDLNSHMVICPHCSVAYQELSALRDGPRTALGDGLLPWSGPAYVRDAPTIARANAHTLKASWPEEPPGTPPRASRRRFVLASAVLGVTLVPLLIVLLSPGDGAPGQRSPAGSRPATSAPSRSKGTAPSSPTAAESPSPSPSPFPSPSPTSRPPTTRPPAPKPTRTAKPQPKPKPTPPPPPVFRAPGASAAQVVNVASGRCLDIRGGVLERGTDVVTAPCSASSATQRWRVDAGLALLRSVADSDLCLDSRGDVDRGVGIWECASVNDDDNGDNLRFTVDSDGVIRPAIAIATGLTPDVDGGLSLEPLTGGSGQRWRAGAA